METEISSCCSGVDGYTAALHTSYTTLRKCFQSDTQVGQVGVSLRYTRIASIACIKDDPLTQCSDSICTSRVPLGIYSGSNQAHRSGPSSSNPQITSLVKHGNWSSATRLVCSFAAHSRQFRCLHSAGAPAFTKAESAASSTRLWLPAVKLRLTPSAMSNFGVMFGSESTRPRNSISGLVQWK